MGWNLLRREDVAMKQKIVLACAVLFVAFPLFCENDDSAQKPEQPSRLEPVEKETLPSSESLEAESLQPSSKNEKKSKKKKQASKSEKSAVPEDQTEKIPSEDLSPPPSEENADSGETPSDESPLAEETVSGQAYSEAELAEVERLEKQRLRDEKVITDIGGFSVPQIEYAQSSIKRFIRQYSTEQGKKRLYEALDDGETYRLYVRQQLRERNMPEILEYLPLVESNYLPRATSRVGAKGIWQFMENSMRPYLVKNAWLDERLDPWRSTDAAISKLQENYRMFGDWELAIAAYNCGAGAMQRAIRASKEKNFWYMAEKKILKSETISYIPKLIAVAEIAANPEFYDIPMPEITASTRFAEFDYVLVNKKINIYRLASELRIDAEYLKSLNPALVRSVTPDGIDYEIRFPVGMEVSARTAISEILSNPDKYWDDFESIHVVESGDSLWSIARKNNCTVEELCALNKMKQTDILKIGREIKVPVPYH